MRKDVKFGLTVGAILVATLIVYVIVLSGAGLGSAGHQDSSATIAIKSPDNSAPAAPSDSAAPTPAHSDESTGTITPAPAAISPPPTVATPDTAAPATQPTAGTSSNFDWDYGLNHGGTPAASVAPAHTVTPTIDSNPAASAAAPTVDITNRPPTIDNIVPMLAAPMSADPPATQPAPEANVPVSTIDPPPVAVAAPQRVHVIESGENLWTIAQAVYGNGALYTKIIAANPGLDPKDLKVGKKLVIPDVSGAEKSPATPAAATDAPLDPTKEYRIASGDTLEKISRKLYGNPSMQDSIYQLNKSLIGDDPDKLKVGWVLKLPQAPAATIDAPR
jgi:nucleoid-associated protein YgaU